MLRTLVGILTGPLTLSLLSLAPRTKSVQTISNTSKKKSEQKDTTKRNKMGLINNNQVVK